jgi:hypothetical protein
VSAVDAAASHVARAEWKVTEAHHLPGQVCGEAVIHAAVDPLPVGVQPHWVTLNLQQKSVVRANGGSSS